MTRADELVEAAEQYLDLGLRVIALKGKMPNGLIHRRGLYDAMTRDAPYTHGMGGKYNLPAAFMHPETTGIGILTGMPYYVVDIDGEEGAERWKEIAGSEYIPDRWVAQTGRRDETGKPTGMHLWVASVESFPTTKLGAKLDFKGEGGYVVAPPSIHPDSGERYEWLIEPRYEMPLEMPEPLLAILRARAFDRDRKVVSRDIRRLQRHAYDPLEGAFFASETSFDGIIKKMVDEPEGNRNGVLYWAARTMIEEGAEGEDLEVLFDAAVAAGLTRVESRRTIRSALHA